MLSRLNWIGAYFMILLAVPVAANELGCGVPSALSSCCSDVCVTDCCGGSDCAGGSCLGCLEGLIKPSDHCFDDFISPMSNFVFFEDPRTLTEARAIFVQHKLPDRVGSLNLPGGDVQLYALQLRFALSERLSVIAVKDGFIVADMDGEPLDTLLNDGWADVTAGLKYNLIRDTCEGNLLSVGFTYELPIGSQRALQDIGDGEFHLFASAGKRLWNGLGHYLGAVGYRLPVDDDVQSSAIHWSNHLDVKLTDRAYLFTEVVWWHWTDAADTGLPLGVSGHDLFNLSSTNVSGNDLVTQNVGVKYKPSGNAELGLAYEFPLSDFEDIIDNRLQVELILRY